jgi:MFS family permease
VLSGIGNGTAVVCNSLLVQRGAADEIRGRVFTVIMAVNYAVFGIGYVVAGPLVDSVGPRWIFGGVGIVLALAAGIAWALARSVPHEVDQPAVAA